MRLDNKPVSYFVVIIHVKLSLMVDAHRQLHHAAHAIHQTQMQNRSLSSQLSGDNM